MATRVGVDPAERGEVVVGGEAVVRVGDTPHAMVRALELAAVGGAAAEVDGEPGVALVDEVLGDAVPLVAGHRGGPTVGLHDRRARVFGRCHGRAVQPAVHLHAVERQVGHVFGHDVRGGQHRGRCRCEQLADVPVVGDDAQPSRRRERLVHRRDRTVGQHPRRRPRAAPGRAPSPRPSAAIDVHQICDTVASADTDQRRAIGRERQAAEVGVGGGELTWRGAIRRVRR